MLLIVNFGFEVMKGNIDGIVELFQTAGNPMTRHNLADDFLGRLAHWSGLAPGHVLPIVHHGLDAIERQVLPSERLDPRMNIGNVIRQQRKNLRENWDAYQEVCHWAPLAEQYRNRSQPPTLPFFCIDEKLEGQLRWRPFLPYFVLRRISPHRGAQADAFNQWIRDRFGVRDGIELYSGDGFELEMPPEFGNAREVVINDLREILIENRYSTYLPGGDLVKDGDVVLDCGGNIGAFTVFAATRAAGVRVVTFEPEVATFQCMSRNVARNGLKDRVTCIQAGVTKDAGEFTLVRHDQCFTMHHLENPSQQASPKSGVPSPGSTLETVKCVSIDATMKELGLDRCDLIKMDIEGAEASALEGAAETITRFRPRMTIACYHKPSDPYVLTTIIRRICPDYNLVVSREGHLYAFV
jgi:FkbM family methyltransferase